MNLRLRFFLLVVGVIFIPILVLGLSYFIFRSYLISSDPRDIAREFNSTMNEIESIEEFRTIAENLDESYFGLMVETPELIVSTNEDLVKYNNPTEEESFSPKMIIQSRVHTLKNGSKVLVILGYNMADISMRFFPIILIISSVSVLIILSLLIIRSINLSIGELEIATGKIAQGDLDFELNTKGSDKFGSLARSLDTMRHQIKMEYDRRNRFLMGISHDLKTPLSSITGYTDALIEGMADDEETTEKYLEIIKNKSHQLEKRISNLIHYIKLSNSDFRAGLEEKSISGYLTEFLEVHEEEAGFREQALNWSVDIPHDYLIAFDEDLLGRALENLIQNGFKYGYEGTPVTIMCILKKSEIEISIKNKGKVIPADVRPHLFEPFFRADKSRQGDGFGLGLASVKSIVESHGWTISVQSEKDSTLFRISTGI